MEIYYTFFNNGLAPGWSFWYLSHFFSVPLYMQSRLSVEFDNLFKKAWEEDAIEELTSDGDVTHSRISDGEFRLLCSYCFLWCLYI